MAKKIIIGLAGEMASGKGAIGKYIKDKYSGESFRISDIFRNILDMLSLEKNRQNFSDLSLTLRETFGEDVLARAIAENVKKSEAEFIFVDGVRRIEDIKYLKEIPEFKLVYVETDIKSRYERLIKRNENKGDKNKSFEEFKKDHKNDADARIKGLKDIADEIVDNNGTIEDLHKRVDELVK